MINYPNKQASLLLLEKWQAMHSEVESIHMAAEAVFGTELENPLFESTWRVFALYSEALSALLGDESGTWLHFYQYECQFGLRQLEAGYQGDLRKIKNREDLFWLIEKSRDQA